jgi:hypothetical protein
MLRGCFIGTVFGAGWWMFGSAQLHGTARLVTVLVGAVVAVALLAACVRLLRAYRQRSGSGGGSPFGRQYAIAVAAMVVAIVAGSYVLRSLHWTQAQPAWVLVCVGVHFLAFSRIFRHGMFTVLAAALVVVAIVGATVGALGVPAGWTAVVGFGAALCLWAHVTIGLANGAGYATVGSGPERPGATS